MTTAIPHKLSVRVNDAMIVGDIEYGLLSSGRVDFGGNLSNQFDYSIKASSADVSVQKLGEGSWTLNQPNYYSGSTRIKAGELKLGHKSAIPRKSAVDVRRGGILNLNSQSPDIDAILLKGGAGSGTFDQMLQGTARITGGPLTGVITSNGGLLSGISGADLTVVSGRTFIRDMPAGTSLGKVVIEGGQLWAADFDDVVTVNDLTLNEVSLDPGSLSKVQDGAFGESVADGLVLGLRQDRGVSLKVNNSFTYAGGNVYLYKPASENAADYEGTFKVFDFDRSDLTDDEYQKLFESTYMLYETPDGELHYLAFGSNGKPVDAELIREVLLEKGSLNVFVGEVDLDKPANGKPGGESLVDIIDDDIASDVLPGGGGSISFDKEAIENIANGLNLWTRGEVVDVVKHGLLPRNVDAAGQTMAAYNNLLTDTIFERTPMRQFTHVQLDAAVEAVAPEVVPVNEPVRGLWSKVGELSDQTADQYLNQKTAQSASTNIPSSEPLVVADSLVVANHQSAHVIAINGTTYAENDSLTVEYAKRDGARGWFRGFGGNSADSNGSSGTIYNPYDLSAGGGVLGVDVSLSDSFQLGAYANYGNLNLSHRNGVEGLGGSWDADGWGGGITADYWTNNFYVQGLLGASGFSGEQRRSIKGYGMLFDGENATGEKSGTSVVGALRVGAPMQSGSTYIEPQFTASWTGNSENRFSESVNDDRLGLTYKSRSTNFLQTALGVKFAWPMKSGTTALITPSVRLAWLGDWSQANEDQTIGFDFTNKTYSVDSNLEDNNGALLEAGFDYSVAKLESTTVKAYLRGGAELWGGNRGTNWRASGGVTFQF